MRNPFAYPSSMGWLPYMAASAPGSMIWLTLENAENGEKIFAFVLRENTTLIESMPKMPSGGVPVAVRSGLIPIDVSSGKRVPMLVVMVHGPGGISEMTVNAMHVDKEALELASGMTSLVMVGDSGSVERSLMFPPNKPFSELFEIICGLYAKYPWTDPDFDEAKRIYESNTDLADLWEEMGQAR